MEKEKLIVIMKRLLEKDDIDFLKKLDVAELAKLFMYIREKIGLPKGQRLSSLRSVCISERGVTSWSGAFGKSSSYSNRILLQSG